MADNSHMRITDPKNTNGIQIKINHRNCRLQVSTPEGPANLAIVVNGKILPIDNVDNLLADAAIEAMLDAIEPSLPEFSRVLPPPKPFW